MCLNDLIKQAEEITPEKFYLVETDLFMEFYYWESKPSFAVAFMGISSWMGTSQRGGVWTYYESTDREMISVTIEYLKNYDGYDELLKMYMLGNHDYWDEKYQDNYDYPQEWLDESEIIDQWLDENEIEINKLLQLIIVENKSNIVPI